MIIGLCGTGFPAVRDALRAALPEAELVDVSSETAGTGPVVDVLAPLGAVVDGGVMDATQPRLIQQFGVGLQGVDLSAARDRAIPVAYVPASGTGNAPAVAEIVFLHLLSLLRRYRAAQHSLAEQRVGQPIGTSLAGKTVTVLGAGGIGVEVVSRLTAFDAVPLVVSRRELSDYPNMARLLPPDRYYRTDGLATALSHSQALIVCCPLTEHTRGLVGADALATMPPGGYVINVGRGPVVDYTALHDALASGQLAGAGIDVAWSEPIDPADKLLTANVTATPHIGGVTTESYTAMAATFARNVTNLTTGQPLEHRAD